MTYPGGRVQREVANRYVAYHESETPRQVSFVRDPDTSKMVHGWMKVNEANGAGQKQWSFETDTDSAFLGLVTTFAQRNGEGQADLTRKTLTWTQVINSTPQPPYVTSVLSEQDPGQSYAVSSKTEQDVDAWGNVTQTRLYDYSSLATPAKTYTNTFLTGTNYTSRNIRNRLLTSTVSDGTNTVTLVTNTYDDYSTYRSGCTTDGSQISGVVQAYLGTPTQWDSTYNTFFYYRGNVTKQVVPGGWTCYLYTVAGAAVKTLNSVGNVSTTAFSSLTNFSAPDTLTSNGFSTTMSWNSWLGLTQDTGPNTGFDIPAVR